MMQVDGAILNAKSRLSLLKDQLVTLSHEVAKTSEVDGGDKDCSQNTSSSIVNNKRISESTNTGTVDGVVTDGLTLSPRSSHSSYAGHKSLQLTVPTSEGEGKDTSQDSGESIASIQSGGGGSRIAPSAEKVVLSGTIVEDGLETDSQWRMMDERVSEAGTYSDDHEAFRSVVDLQEGSSSSSRSWSLGRSVGFGPNGTDLILHREGSRNATLPSSHHRRFDSPFRSDLYQLAEGQDHRSPSSPLNSKKETNPEHWILNTILPFSCWPKEEITDFRWSSNLKNAHQQHQHQHHIRSLPSRGGSKVSKINHAVRNAIGKIWDEYSIESAHSIWDLINNFLNAEEDGKIDAPSCWVSGKALSSIADGLPFAFTIHTYTSLSKPCISGHANITVEVTAMDMQNADAFEKAFNDCEQRAYGLSSKSSFSLPDPLSPHHQSHHRARDNPSPQWHPRQLLSDDFETAPPLFPICEQGEGASKDVRKQRKEALNSKDAGSESISTFSFNSIQQGKRDHDHPTSGSSETLSTADLTAFIRNGQEINKQQQQQQQQTTLQRQYSNNAGTASPDLDSSLNSQQSRNKVTGHKAVFSEMDLVWEMHYPDFEKLETVIASRKYQKNEVPEENLSFTYIGDTDSDSSSPGPQSSTNQELMLVHKPDDDDDDDDLLTDHDRKQQHELFENQQHSSETKSMMMKNQNATNQHAAQQRSHHSERDSDPWSNIQMPYRDAKKESSSVFLTDSMEVNFEDEQERGRKWGRIQKLSSFVRRVKKMIGTSSASDSKRQVPSLQTLDMHRDQDLTTAGRGGSTGGGRAEFYSPESSTPRERQYSRSPVRSPEGFYSAPSSESEVQNVNHSGDQQQQLAQYHSTSGNVVDSPVTRKSTDSAVVAYQDSNLLLTGASYSSSVGGSGQNVTWDESRSVQLPVKDLGNGQYLALGHLSGQGKYRVNVKIGNKKIFEDSIVTSVMDPCLLGSGISINGPFFQRPDALAVTSSSTVPVPHPDYPPCHSVSYDPDRLDYALRHPHVGYVDLLFIVDCTSSMGQELQQLPSLLGGIEDLVKDSVLLKRVRMGVIAYRDHDPEDADTFLLRKQDLTEDIEKVKRFLRGLEAEGGGDYPEAMEVAFEEAVDGIKWSLFSSRFVLWIGDAPPHGYQGFTHKQALEEENKFKNTKSALKKAAYAVDIAMKNEESPRQLNIHDKELADALSACDAIAKYHDKYPLGIPGRVRWEETIEKLSSIGVRAIIMGLRDAVSHEASRNCLRAIAHVTGGALLEIIQLDSSVIAPLLVAIIEQALDQQLIEEEVCDLILCFQNDFENQSPDDKRRNLIESMSQAAKQPHRLQVAPKSSFSNSPTAQKADHQTIDVLSNATYASSLVRPDSSTSNAASSRTGSVGSLGPLTISGGSFDLQATSMNKLDSRALLLGMVSIRFDEDVLEHVLQSLKMKAEVVSHCLISNFETAHQWFEFHLCHVSDALYRGERSKISGLSAPLSLRYVLAMHTMTLKH